MISWCLMRAVRSMPEKTAELKASCQGRKTGFRGCGKIHLIDLLFTTMIILWAQHYGILLHKGEQLSQPSYFVQSSDGNEMDVFQLQLEFGAVVHYKMKKDTCT